MPTNYSPGSLNVALVKQGLDGVVGGCCDSASMDEHALTRQKLGMREASEAVHDLGWRFILGVLRTSVRVDSLTQASHTATQAVAACGPDADEHLRLDIRRDRVELSLQAMAVAAVTARDVELANRITAAVADLGLRTDPEVAGDGPRSIQAVEIAIDALNIAAVRPFWKAVMGYTDEATATGPQDPLVDPIAQGPAIWFQQMEAPRPQRNRIHLDISVAHDEAAHRIRAALDVGGALISDASAPAFWVLADPEGNEACITTWQGRED